MAILKVNGLSLGYEKQVVIKDISFEVNNKDFILVIGSNGAGKSTLIKGILGIIKPISGEIIYDSETKNHIGYMPQETKVDRNFPASVMEIVLSGLINKMGRRPFYNKEDKEKAREALKILKIENLEKKIFSELSGGQRQKVLLARSLCATTNLLILDEPSNNLDQESKVEFYSTLKHLNEGHGITIIMITHDITRDREAFIGNKVLELRPSGYFFDTTEKYMEELGYDS
ncbi:MAG: ABC transporter ATP-binding protein [Acholeplasmatales bacterium]|jgi:zinc transport system ATP-binding protein|nr:ABC transporter ATP-binding protein [Acholeplasmatales bacterium]